MRVHMIGNAHIDPVWLWPWQAGADEALATAASMADRCDEYPEFVFTRGEAWLYQQAERLRPVSSPASAPLIERGQWHITGGQFIQPDLNLPTAAGLHRQIVHGQRYFRDRFGIAPTVGYNVDSFGHTATLPDILAEHGYAAYVFRRPEQHQVALPANIFRWRGVERRRGHGLPHRPGLRRELRRPRRPGAHRRRERRPGARPHHVLLRRRQPWRRPVQGDDRMDPRQPRLRRPRARVLHAPGLLRSDRRPARPSAARHHRAPALLPRLLQRHARHQVGAAPRRAAARPGRVGREHARRRRCRARRRPCAHRSRPGTTSSSPSSTTS